MFVVHSYPLAVVFCVLTMLCWGSWAVTRKLARPEWRFELFYWDYTLGVVLVTLTFGVTLGSGGSEGRAFFPDLAQASTASLTAALAGGAIFNLANILLVAAIDTAGMAVAFPVGIGLALIIGVIMNYLAAPIGNVALLSGGVSLVILAIILDALAYRRLAAGSPGGEARSSARGLLLSVACGVFMGLFYRFVAAAMYADPAHATPGKLGCYAAVFMLAVGVLLSSFVWNVFAMKKPLAGAPVSFRDYFAGSLPTHMTGVLGGMIWGAGTTLNLIASGRAGFAISYGLGQGATMIAAIWGVFIWKEFRTAPAGTSTLLATMFGSFLAGLALIVLSRVM
ncbi:MAG TPA: GRP family sugar transporter [Steroidobacteraceae bacterium]|nr:GRP family sugar transporter [Steroidobacteraceae bacterium]